MSCPSDVLRPLRAVRRRMLAQSFLVSLVRATLLLGALLALWMMGSRLAGRPMNGWIEPAAAAALAILGAAAWTAARRPMLQQVAQTVDRLGQTRDRFQTALVFSTEETEPEPGMRFMALEECRKFIRSRDFSCLFTCRLPREMPWLAAPLAAIALLQWEARVSASATQREKDAAQAAVADTVQKLENLSRQTAETSKQTRSEELKRLSEELKRGAEQLRANANQRTEAEKAALRELSALEQMVKDTQNEQGKLSQEEMNQLAEALKQNDATKDAADQLEKGDKEAAAKALEEAAKQLAEKKDAQSAEQVQQALKQAMDRLAQQKQLSQAMKQLSQRAQQNAAQNGASSQLLQQIAQMLRQMQGQQGQQNGGQPQNGKQMDQQALQQLLAALQNMKYGQGQQQQGKNSKQQGDGPPTIVQSFDKSGSDGAPMGGNAQMPTGMPGSEHDTGTTDTPFGKRVDPASQKGADIALKGQLGEGESLSQLMPSAADGSKAKRRYKELYEAMAPAAEDAVTQENIPLGSRFFVKRYFEAIRPKE